MDFTYSKMWKWYTDAYDTVPFPATDDIVVKVYDVEYGAKKYGRENRLPFTNPVVKVARVTDELILASVPTVLLQHGLFVVSDDLNACHTEDARLKAMRKKQLFFVFPTERRDASGELFFAADHFSFGLDKNDKKTPLHFHMTEYVPDRVMHGRGSTIHNNDYMPSAFTLPIASGDFRMRLSGYAPFVHELMSHPLTQPLPPQRQIGGTKNRRRKRRQRATQPGALSFTDAWLALPLHKLIVLAVKNAETYDVTLVVYDRLLGVRSEESRASCALVKIPRGVVMNDAALEERIATEFLSKLTWDSFRPGNYE